MSTTATAVTGHVGGRRNMTERLRALLDPGFLVEIGWDETDLVLRPPADHRQLGRPVCRAEGCGKTAHGASRICRGCTKALARHGLTEADIAVLPPRQRSGPGRCVVPGLPTGLEIRATPVVHRARAPAGQDAEADAGRVPHPPSRDPVAAVRAMRGRSVHPRQP